MRGCGVIRLNKVGTGITASAMEASSHSRAPQPSGFAFTGGGQGVNTATNLLVGARVGCVRTLRGQSWIRHSLPPPGFSESGIHLASATGKPLGFLWIHVKGFINWANRI